MVEVRSREEVLRTLDEEGKLDALPFMPEMLDYCGKRFRVFKRADKTCDTIENTGGRRMLRAVHLQDVRCDGEAHGGCQAGCLIFWKESWLRRVPKNSAVDATPTSSGSSGVADHLSLKDEPTLCTETTLKKASRIERISETSGEEVFACQATELKRATSSLVWWDIRQYIRDVTSGNVRISEVIRAVLFWMFTKALRIGGYRALLWSYNAVQRRIGGCPYPFLQGQATKTPSAVLDLQPGELVQVRPYEEILQTINARNRNRGLTFDAEMVRYCNGTFRVLRRVDKIINEKTGKMIRLPNDCIILDDVICTAQYSGGRLFCPRSIYSYWREIWLKRAE